MSNGPFWGAILGFCLSGKSKSRSKSAWQAGNDLWDESPFLFCIIFGVLPLIGMLACP